MAVVAFALFLLLVFYVYLGYPLLMRALSSVRSRPVKKARIEPTVSLIIAAYNEEKNIREKILNCLALDYPEDKLEIIVASDCSTDGTDAMVSDFANQGVILHRQNERKGKTAAQNSSVAKAKGEIILFSDATTIYEKDVIRRLVQNFADPGVGLVSGELEYVNAGASRVGHGGRLYWRYERHLKKLESALSSLIGVSGCCYAIRKHLYRPISESLISDFVIAAQVYEKGFRVVYEPEARVYEETLISPEHEFKMRVRVAIRSYQALVTMRRFLNPLRHGLFAFQLLSHKLLRYAVPLFLLGMLISNLFLLEAPAFRIALAAQLLFYLSALAGLYQQRRTTNKSFLIIPFYFGLVNLAAVVALLRFLKGDRGKLWEPLRSNTHHKVRS